MEIALIQIGNSRGVRLPKAVLQQYGEFSRFVLEVKKNAIVLKPIQAPRKNWETFFRELNENKEDELILE